MSDLSMVTPTVELADNFADRQVPVYVYQFSHVSSSMEESFLGSYHSSELNYLFGATFTGIDVDSYNEVIHNYTDTDRDVSIRMMTQWSNFVKFGYLLSCIK
jgi:carboxylesterase type B